MKLIPEDFASAYYMRENEEWIVRFVEHSPSVRPQFRIIDLLRACTAFNSLCSCAAVDSNLATHVLEGLQVEAQKLI